MSDSSPLSPRPVALITTLFIFALSAVGYVIVSHYYVPAPAAPQNQTADNFPLVDKDKKPTDLAWKSTPTTRKQALAELREKQAKQAESYAWIDKNAGVLQLPIQRAMDLTAAQYGSK